MRPCFRVSRWRRLAVWMFMNLGKVSGATLFGEESSKGIEHERKFMMMMLLLWSLDSKNECRMGLVF